MTTTGSTCQILASPLQHPQAMVVCLCARLKAPFEFTGKISHVVPRARQSVTRLEWCKDEKEDTCLACAKQMVSCASIPSVTCIRLLKRLCVQSFEDIEAAFGRRNTYLTRKRRASAASFSVVVTTKPFESVT